MIDALHKRPAELGACEQSSTPPAPSQPPLRLLPPPPRPSSCRGARTAEARTASSLAAAEGGAATPLPCQAAQARGKGRRAPPPTPPCQAQPAAAFRGQTEGGSSGRRWPEPIAAGVTLVERTPFRGTCHGGRATAPMRRSPRCGRPSESAPGSQRPPARLAAAGGEFRPPARLRPLSRRSRPAAAGRLSKTVKVEIENDSNRSFSNSMSSTVELIFFLGNPTLKLAGCCFPSQLSTQGHPGPRSPAGHGPGPVTGPSRRAA